jgi:hypothetical protein
VTKIGELGTTQAATSNRRTLFFAVTRRNNPEDTILHCHRRENLKSYIEMWLSVLGTDRTLITEIFLFPSLVLISATG